MHGAHGPTAEVVVHVDADLLTRLRADGRALDLGRRTRRPTERQTQALMRRDAGCTTPGCGRRRFLHAHHVRPWSRGGPTNMDNLVLLCGEHHRALHSGAFTISVLGRQRFRFRAPDDTVIEYEPALRGTAADADAAYPLVHGDTITPDWHGERLQPDLLVDSYVRARRAEGDVAHRWSAAA